MVEEVLDAITCRCQVVFNSIRIETPSCSITSLPIVVKGVLRPDDAELAVQHGVSAIAVSNHGGRQLDGVLATVRLSTD